MESALIFMSTQKTGFHAKFLGLGSINEIDLLRLRMMSTFCK